MRFRPLSALLIVFCFLQGASAQTLTLNPYSRYGVGDIFSISTARNMAMGDLGVATMNIASINRLNPASYADLVFTTLDVSGFTQGSQLRTLRKSENQFSAGFQNVSFAFPSNNKLVLAFGFSPYSAIGYNISQSYQRQLGDSLLNVTHNYSADGGLNQAFIGAGYPLFKQKLKIGLNGYYVFGNTRNSWQSFISGDAVNYNPAVITRRTFLSGGGLQAGIIFADTLKYRASEVSNNALEPPLLIRIGLTADYSLRINGDRVTTFYTYTNASNQPVEDSIGGVEFGQVVLPPRLGFGASLTRPGKWELSAEAYLQNWTQFKYFNDPVSLSNGLRIAAGGEWIPNFWEGKFFGRTAYRAGFHYESTYLVDGANPIRDYGLSLGVGLPAARKGTTQFNRERLFSQASIGITAGKRGDIKQGHTLEQLYLRGRIGITINERWFRRFQVD